MSYKVGFLWAFSIFCIDISNLSSVSLATVAILLVCVHINGHKGSTTHRVLKFSHQLQQMLPLWLRLRVKWLNFVRYVL